MTARSRIDTGTTRSSAPVQVGTGSTGSARPSTSLAAAVRRGGRRPRRRLVRRPRAAPPPGRPRPPADRQAARREAPDADRVWKSAYGDPLDLLLLGDSIAAGLGADRRKDTLGGTAGQGSGQADRTGPCGYDRRRSSGRSPRSSPPSSTACPTATPPTSRSIVVGGNDVTHRVPVAESVAHLEAAIARLRAVGTEVVVGTCPDLGRAAPGAAAAARLGSRASRQLADAQARAAVGPGRTRCRCAASSVRSSSTTPTRCSASTASTRARSATAARPRRCCPRCSRAGPARRDARSGYLTRRRRTRSRAVRRRRIRLRVRD